MVTGITRSQVQHHAYHLNSAIYLRPVKHLNDPEVNTLYHRAVPYLMYRNHSVDIDNESDFLVASAIASTGLIK